MRLNPFRRRPSISQLFEQAGAQFTEAFVHGLTEEPTGTPEERAVRRAEMLAYAEATARRSFATLYTDDT